MNKFLSKIAVAFIGLTMAMGVGAALAVSHSGEVAVRAAETTVNWTASKSSELGSAISEVNGTATGTISTGNYEWDYTRKLVSLANNKSDYIAFMGNTWIQLGSGNALESISFETSNIPGIIKSVSVTCATAGTHNLTIDVGGKKYVEDYNITTYSGSATATNPDPNDCVITKTVDSSGKISISIASSNTTTKKALLVKSISVSYEENSDVSCTGISASLTDPTKILKKGQTVTGSDVTVYAEFSDGTDATITNGVGVTITNGTLNAGNNEVTVSYSGKTDTVSVFGRAPTDITVVTSSGSNTVNLNASGSTAVTDDLAYEVVYNTSPTTTDYAATLECDLSGWSKISDDGAGNITLKFESNGTFDFILTSDDDAEVVEKISFVVTGISTTEYELFSGAIEEGKYLITVDGYALKNEISGDRGSYDSIFIVNEKVSTPAPAIIWEIKQSGEYWTIYNEGVNKYFASNGKKNNAALSDYASDDKLLWTIEENSTGIYYFSNKYNKDKSINACLQKNGEYGFACYGSYSNVKLYKLSEPEKSIIDSRMVAGNVLASTGNSEWTLSGFEFFVTYEGESETNVTSKTTFNVVEAIPDIKENGSMQVTVIPTFKGVEYGANSATVTATLTFINDHAISLIYDKPGDTNFVVDGVYMGIIPGSGYIFQNGEYGILVYNKNAAESTYVIGNYYTLSGASTIYNGLYELKNGTTISALSDESRIANVESPKTYVVVGGEDDAKLANRKTSLHGVVSKRTATKSGNNDTVTISVNGKDVTMYVKNSNNTSGVYDAITNSLNNETAITIEGFTSWYNGFQVQFTGLVQADDGYHAADFARSLLKLTRSICASSNEGNASSLTGVWTELSGADHWLKVQTNGEESLIKNGVADSSIVVPATDELIDEMSDSDAIGAALYRYDWCTAKYNLTNFTSRNLSVSFQSRVGILSFGDDSSNATSITVIVSLISSVTMGAYFFISKRRKEN